MNPALTRLYPLCLVVLMRAPSKHCPNRDFVKKAQRITRVKNVIKKAQNVWGNEIDTRSASPTDEPYEPLDVRVVHQVKYRAGKINGHTLAKCAGQRGLLKQASAILQKIEASRDTQEEAKAVASIFGNLDLAGVSSMGSVMSSLSTGDMA